LEIRKVAECKKRRRWMGGKEGAYRVVEKRQVLREDFCQTGKRRATLLLFI